MIDILPEGTKIYLSKKQAAAKLGITVRGLESLAQRHDDFPEPSIWGDARQARVRYADNALDVWMESQKQSKKTVENAA